MERFSESEEPEFPLLNISAIRPTKGQNGFMLELLVDQKPMVMELDTGASLSLISERTWRKTLGGVPLENSEIKLRTYSGEGLQVLGKKNVMVKYGKQEFCLPLIVVKGDGVSLFGRNWLEVIKLDWKVINKLSSPLDQLLSKHQEVFQE